MGCGSSNSQVPDNSSPQNAYTGENKTAHANPGNSTGGTKQKTVKDEQKTASSGNRKFEEDALRKHNDLRKKHSAQALTLADDLTAYAQKWADDIAKRDRMEHSKCTLPSGDSVGENIYMCWSSDGSAAADANDAVQSWYDEIKDYDFNKQGFAMNTGHFTQVVWKESKELGIAWAKSKGGSIYVVANYRPSGNYEGDFEANVTPS
ncbi:Golgi-associated plant pathogenesis-related protein 1-like [Dreissena polymorpha]|uniref:SCP domain-containing protein n=1 Tax=Dreissena polymorpha TaxID=45954 RepID=A0A9D4I633_DREPO|nr:Golgi-associated plant pathogenesis-related protein 1-like [Dreissena polymorpha]KAH3748673.1 hypothetical protein DPMN_183121 [Dreissena polymorpha]